MAGYWIEQLKFADGSVKNLFVGTVEVDEGRDIPMTSVRNGDLNCGSQGQFLQFVRDLGSVYLHNNVAYFKYESSGLRLFYFGYSSSYISEWTVNFTEQYVGFYVNTTQDRIYKVRWIPSLHLAQCSYYGTQITEYLKIVLEIATPIIYNYKPIAYFKSNFSHRNLSMIKESETNHGDIVTDAPETAFVRLADVPTPTSNIRKIAPNLTIGQLAVFARTSPTNYATITRLADGASGELNYQFDYYINAVLQSSITHTVSLPSNVDAFLSYLIDTENDAARPSFIYETFTGVVPNVNLTISYNTETVDDIKQAVWFEWIADGYSLTLPDNPYDFGGDSTTTDENNGTFDTTTENIPIADNPTFEITSSGFIKIFSPTKQQISDLADYMWGALFDVDTLKKLFANPMDCILNLSVVPCVVSKEPTPQVLKVGNVSTGVSLDVASSQYVTINCGDIDLQEFYGGYLDYAPYTKVSVYLPYIATVNLDTDEVMGKTLNITYKIDILTGACIATIKSNDAVLYHFSGTCGVNIPLTSQSYNNTLSNIVGIAGSVVSAIATKGSSVVANSALAVNTANAVMTSKADIAHSGSFGSVIGFMDIQRPYLIVEIPRQCKAENQESYKGLPTHVDFELSELSGYTEIETIHLENMSCTDAEIREIETLLQSGVIF